MIVTADDNALRFAQKWRDRLFQGTKIVFLGINNQKLALEQNANPDIVGVVEHRSVGETLDLASSLFPKSGVIHILEDDTPTGRINRRLMTDILQSRPNMFVVRHSLGEMTYKQLVARLGNLDASTPVFMNSSARDIEGQHMDSAGFIAELRTVFSGPIFTVQRNAVGAGALGGKIVSHFEQGRVAASFAAKILTGTPASTLRVISESPNLFTFDYREAKRFGLDVDALPAGSVILNEPVSTVQKYAYWIVVAMIALAIQSGLILLLVINARKRKLAEASLRESDARFRTFFDNSPSVMYIKDRNHSLSYVNAKYLSFHGVAEDDVIGKRGASTLSPKQRENIENLDRQVMDQEITSNSSVSMSSQSDELRQFYMTKFPVYGAEGDVVGIGGINTDVTELHQREQELIVAKTEAEQAAEKAKAADKSKSQFLANMSHEIRTPMNGVLGMADLLARTELAADQREFVDTLKESGKNLLDLLNDILDLSKIEAGHIELECHEFSVGDLLKSTSTFWGHVAQDKGLEFSIGNAATKHDVIRGDRTRLRQIINNLIGNAIKFTSQGKIELRVAENLESENRLTLRFEIEDTGIGISDDKIDAVFKPFTQADNSTTRHYGGTGLGLSICKNLLDLLGGEIGVESTPGRGSVFWFTVSAVPGNAGEEQGMRGEEDLQPKSGPSGASDLHLLVAEDNLLNQKIISWMLAPLGCQIDIVNNGIEAVAAIARTNYDLVLMDVLMPQMDGVAATEKIRSLTDPAAQVPIIAMTANAMHGDREKYLSAGMTDYVSKPVDQRELFSTIARLTHTVVPDFEIKDADTEAVLGEPETNNSAVAGK